MNNPYSELAHRAMDKVKTSFPEDLHRLATLSQSDFSKLAPRGSNPADVCALKKAVDEAAAKICPRHNYIQILKIWGHRYLHLARNYCHRYKQTAVSRCITGLTAVCNTYNKLPVI